MDHVGKKNSKGKIIGGMVKSDIPHTSMDFESLIEHGEPEKFTAQTPNGTAKWAGTGWNAPGRAGWAAGSFTNNSPQLEPMPTRPPGRSNRTGE